MGQSARKATLADRDVFEVTVFIKHESGRWFVSLSEVNCGSDSHTMGTWNCKAEEGFCAAPGVTDGCL